MGRCEGKPCVARVDIRHEGISRQPPSFETRASVCARIAQALEDAKEAAEAACASDAPVDRIARRQLA